MTDFESQVISQLSEIKSAVSKAAAVSEALDTRLFDPETGFIPMIKNENHECNAQRQHLETRVTLMEDKHKYDDLKDYIHYGTGPLMLIVHGVLRHFGIDV